MHVGEIQREPDVVCSVEVFIDAVNRFEEVERARILAEHAANERRPRSHVRHQQHLGGLPV